MDEDATWHFREMFPGEMNEDPVQGEFFTQQDLADRLVRETLQNSLDESSGPDTPVRVRFAFRGLDEALSHESAAKYLAGLSVHLDSTEGVPESVKAIVRDVATPMPCFIIEDFGTKGLVGDPSQSDDWAGQPAAGNSFYWFFRNVGRSGKGETEAGSWGLGKWVFPDASQIHSFFAFSKRIDDGSSVLMGQSVLKKHTIGSPSGEHVKYAPYGFYCCLDESGLQMPTMTGGALDQARADFGLSRSNETGLSIVIPYPHDELRYQDVVRAVVHYYFYPIVVGNLIVEVEDEGEVIRIDLDTIDSVAEHIDWSSSRVTANEMKRLFQLALWLRTLPPAERIDLADPPQLTIDGRIDNSAVDDLRVRFEDGQRLAFRVSLPVTRSGSQSTERSYFDVCLERDDGLSEGQDYFVRHMLAIPEMDFIRSKPVRGFLLVEDAPLHALLRDSEDPSHSKWRPNAPRARERYDRARSTVIFVNHAMERLIALLSKPIEHVDQDALIDTFYVETLLEEEGEEPTTGTNDDGTVTGGPGGSTARPQPFAVDQVAGGFVIRSKPGATRPLSISVEVAYTVRRGNPIKNYSPLDFSLAQAPISCHSEGAVVSCSENRMTITPESDEFRIEAEGFDPRRDLYVRARAGGEQ